MLAYRRTIGGVGPIVFEYQCVRLELRVDPHACSGRAVRKTATSWGFGLCILFGNGTPSLLGNGKWDVGSQANVDVCVSQHYCTCVFSCCCRCYRRCCCCCNSFNAYLMSFGCIWHMASVSMFPMSLHHVVRMFWQVPLASWRCFGRWQLALSWRHWECGYLYHRISVYERGCLAVMSC